MNFLGILGRKNYFNSSSKVRLLSQVVTLKHRNAINLKRTSGCLINLSQLSKLTDTESKLSQRFSIFQLLTHRKIEHGTYTIRFLNG